MPNLCRFDALARGTRDRNVEFVVQCQLILQGSAEILVVTTPQLAAREVAERAGSIALQTHQRIAGVVENMSYLPCPHCGEAIDVFGSEPLPAAPHFEGCPNLLLTPHIAGLSAEANERVSSLIAQRVLEALAR